MNSGKFSIIRLNPSFLLLKGQQHVSCGVAESEFSRITQLVFWAVFQQRGDVLVNIVRAPSLSSDPIIPYVERTLVCKLIACAVDVAACEFDPSFLWEEDNGSVDAIESEWVRRNLEGIACEGVLLLQVSFDLQLKSYDQE
jgi:hypothetical protein